LIDRFKDLNWRVFGAKLLRMVDKGTLNRSRMGLNAEDKVYAV